MARNPKELDTPAHDDGPVFKILPVDAHVIKAGEAPPPELAPKTVRVTIVKRFRLLRQDHTTQIFDPTETNCDVPGQYEVTAEDAAHPYLRAHTDNPPPSLLEPGTLAYAEDRKKELRRQHIQDLIHRQQESEAVAEVRRQQLTALRDRMGGDKSGLEDSNA